MSLAYFGKPGLPERLHAIPLEYFRDALNQLRAALPGAPEPLTILGISRGSEAALLTAVHFGPLVDAVVASVPGNVALCSWPPGGPAWTLAGAPLPYVSRFGPNSELEAAVIPVERIRGPILSISAGADQVWPSQAMARAIAARRKSLPIATLDRLLEYPSATHFVGYLLPQLPGGPIQARGAEADLRARSDAWPKVLGFLAGLGDRR